MLSSWNIIGHLYSVDILFQLCFDFTVEVSVTSTWQMENFIMERFLFFIMQWTIVKIDIYVFLTSSHVTFNKNKSSVIVTVVAKFLSNHASTLDKQLYLSVTT